jgi:hypothetical protein
MGNPAESLLDMMPAKVRQSCTHDSLMWNVFGLVPGQSQCQDCGVVVELHHYDTFPRPWCCTGCGRPWPRRCVAKGCPNIVQPVEVRVYRGDKSWNEPEPHCDSCKTESVREHREKVLVRGRGMNPWGLPQRIRADASKGYWAAQSRKGVDAIADSWLASNLGREHGDRPVLYLHSKGPGTGKSTGAARLVVRAVSGGKARSLVWARESDLFRHLATRGDHGPREDLLRRLYDCALLVVDELFKNEGAQYRIRDGALSRVGETLRDVFHARFEDNRPTIFTSNAWCGDRSSSLWSGLFGEALASRFFAAARLIECDGPDLRASEE